MRSFVLLEKTSCMKVSALPYSRPPMSPLEGASAFFSNFWTWIVFPAKENDGSTHWQSNLPFLHFSIPRNFRSSFGLSAATAVKAAARSAPATRANVRFMGPPSLSMRILVAQSLEASQPVEIRSQCDIGSPGRISNEKRTSDRRCPHRTLRRGAATGRRQADGPAETRSRDVAARLHRRNVELHREGLRLTFRPRAPHRGCRPCPDGAGRL